MFKHVSNSVTQGRLLFNLQFWLYEKGTALLIFIFVKVKFEVQKFLKHINYGQHCAFVIFEVLYSPGDREQK